MRPSSPRDHSVWSRWPWYLPSKTSTVERPVATRAMRSASVLAPVAERVNCHCGQAEPLGEQPADLHRVGGRQQEVVAEQCLVVDRSHDRLRGEPGRHRQIAGVEVHVDVAVKILEP